MILSLARNMERMRDMKRVADLMSLKAVNRNGLTRQQFIDAGKSIKAPPHHLKAFYKVESRERGFNSAGRLTILYEPHWVHRRTKGFMTGKKFDWEYKGTPLKIPLSYRRWHNRNRGRYPVTKPIKWHPYMENQLGQWEMLAMAYEVHPNAIEGASYGAFQVLGRWWRELGFGSCIEMLAYMYQGEICHLDVAIRYLRMCGADGIPALRRGDWHTLERLYNGGGQGGAFARKLEDAAIESEKEFRLGKRVVTS